MEKIYKIGELSELLGISIDTLRRMDARGELISNKTEGQHRLYTHAHVLNFLENADLFNLGENWIKNESPKNPPPIFHCTDASIFQSRLTKLEKALLKDSDTNTITSLIVSITGEIGNNSFDHNIGNWPDIRGIFFGFNLKKKQICLADRGRGILKTLERIRPTLKSHQDALRVAFTEVITGRAPEKRGNGLKFVRQIVTTHPLKLEYQTGNARLKLKRDDSDLIIAESKNDYRGCIAKISF